MSLPADDEAFCAGVLAASKSSFAMPIRLLPAAKRKAMTALYAFCRRADDIVDEPADTEDGLPGGEPQKKARMAATRSRLTAFREGLDRALDGGGSDDPVLRAIARTAQAYAIPPETLHAVLDGVQQDLEQDALVENKPRTAAAFLFESFDELEAYCRRVASAVGLASIHIWGFRGPEAFPAADACGIAFQMTNILRDVSEDLTRGRIYLPRNDFTGCGCDVEELLDGRTGPAYERLLAVQIARTRRLFHEAALLDRFLSTDGRLIFRAMYGVYRALFAEICRRGTQVLRERPRVSRLRLTGSLVATLAAGPRLLTRGERRAVTLPGLSLLSPAEAEETAEPIVIVGGGLAGLAAAQTLVEAGVVARGTPVRLLEARRQVGGRAASFEDRHAGGLVDACQHVAMGCCTNFLDLCRRTGIGRSFREDRVLWFIGPDGRRAGCRPARWLPAPLHLVPLLGAMPHLSMFEKLALGRGMLQLVRWQPRASMPEVAAAWLEAIGQPQRVIDLFWQPVLESALGESLAKVSVEASRKVLVDGFLAHPHAADLHVPVRPLGELFGEGIAGWLRSHGVSIESGVSVTGLEYDEEGLVTAVVAGRRQAGEEPQRIACQACIVAVPWRAAERLVPNHVPAADEQLAGSPITAVHLWFDRAVVDLPHAVLVGRLSQWVFRPDDAMPDGDTGEERSSSRARGYCQVVISGSHDLVGADRSALIERIVAELREIFPAAREAALLDAKIVTDPTAVLSVRPGVDDLRPASRTSIDNLFLAGDWIATGWPSTMEGAVRSGRMAAGACLAWLGRPEPPLSPDLTKGFLVRLAIGRRGERPRASSARRSGATTSTIGGT